MQDEASPEEIIKMLQTTDRGIPLLDDSCRVVELVIPAKRAFLPVSEPSLVGNERKYVDQCMQTGWVSSAGKFVTKFEEMFASFCDTRYAVSSSNGTAALHLALLALGIGPGDEVIVPSFTFISTANAVVFTGATPVFVDSEIETWNISSTEIEKAITKKTKAIIPVHIYGHPADMASVLKIARRYDLRVIEDAAEAHGALYKGGKVGSFSDVGIFSFYGNKTITTGEGGMAVTDNKDLADKIRILRDHGMDPEKRYHHSVLGYNYRLTNIQAAMGVGQMERIEDILNRKRSNAEYYNKKLEFVPGITLPPQAKWAKNIYWLYSILVDEKEFGLSANELGRKLQGKSIETRPLFPPVHKQPIYNTSQCLPVCEYLSSSGLSLPSSSNLCRNQINRVVEVVKSIQKHV